MQEYDVGSARATLRYHDLPGEDTPILFIHGLGCAGSFDYPQVAAQPQLAGHRRILIDLLGAGFSDRPEDFGYTADDHAAYLAEFAAHLGLNSCILFGHSLGGAVALSLAARCAPRVSRIILSEANLDQSGEGDTSYLIAGFDIQEFLGSGFEKLVRKSREKNNRMWAASFSLWSPKAAYLLSRCAAEPRRPWRQILYSLECPRTFIFGEHSLPDPDTEVLAAHGILIEIVKGAGHAMALENPQGLAEAISRGIRHDA
jgi:pimeloyl-ACP methyl ester carboxylesterase